MTLHDTPLAATAEQRDFTPTITVIGRGSVRVPPDRVVFTFELEALTPSVDETQRCRCVPPPSEISATRLRWPWASSRAD